MPQVGFILKIVDFVHWKLGNAEINACICVYVWKDFGRFQKLGSYNTVSNTLKYGTQYTTIVVKGLYLTISDVNVLFISH